MDEEILKVTVETALNSLSLQQQETFPGWELTHLNPSPEEEWDRLRIFLALGEADIQAMLQTVEPLFRRGHELVVETYAYLQKNPETAAILGWDQAADPEHLAERRRFFTLWLARTLGLDLSHDFARYLFRAGQMHAGHGRRQVHVPELYVTGAISLVNSTFARFLTEEMSGYSIAPAALAGWNKCLSLHLNSMLQGYRSAVELDQGDFPVQVSFFGRMRTLLKCKELVIRHSSGAPVAGLLRKLFNYLPHARAEVFDISWQEGERVDAAGTPWLTVEKSYHLRPGWRLQLNGRDLAYRGGVEALISSGDGLQFFPPGR